MVKLFAAAARLPGGWAENVLVGIERDCIATLEVGASGSDADERHDLLLPAVGNVHSHAFQRAMSGLAERRGPGDDSFWSWRQVMYQFALSMTPDDVEAVAAQLYVEMLEAGFARVGEFHYLHHDQDGRPYANIAEMAERIAAASVEAGIGLTLLPVFYAHGGFGTAAPTEGQRRFLNDRQRFGALVEASRRLAASVPGSVMGIAPHSLRAASLDEIRAILPLAEGGPVHIHIAEQVLEVEACLAAHAARPVELLLAELPVDQRWCLVHATHLSGQEVGNIARSGAVIGLCPITEANLGDGIFSGADFFAQKGRFGVGSDSNLRISLRGELAQYEYSQRLGRRSRNVIAAPGQSTGLSLFEEALAGGAAALGSAAGIAIGHSADLFSLDTTATGHLPRDAQLDAWIFGQDGAVGDVWARGRKQVVGGRHVRRTAVRQRFERTMVRLLSA
ncbi:MAG: formimidoylglutamate deiminase [Devosia sp.]|nr:formimidoylglutamate deiminase [Devosia sp.]